MAASNLPAAWCLQPQRRISGETDDIKAALYTLSAGAQTRVVSFDNPLLLAAGGCIAAAAIWFVSSYFSRGAKLSRRRRRSHARLKPKVNRPMVRLSVRTGKRK